MTAVGSLAQKAPGRVGNPRFDNGMVSIQELIRPMAESLVNEIMDACADGNHRNGYRERSLVAGVGTASLRIPKIGRGGCFSDALLTR